MTRTTGRRRALGTAAVALLLAAALLRPLESLSLELAKTDPALVRVARAHPDSRLSVLVQETRPSTGDAETAVRDLGGTVSADLPLIAGFAARIPARALAALAGDAAVGWVWGDARVRVSAMSGWDLAASGGSPNSVWRENIGLLDAVSQVDGSGVTVAVLDTGITEVSDLGDRVLVRVDLSPDGDGYDRYGHGTHMAGIVAGDGSSSGGDWVGAAPGANIVSVKVASEDGSTDVSEVIAGLQWIVANRELYAIRVLSLSFGTDSRQPYRLSPLNHAVEEVWRSGVLVVVAAGNRGPNPGTVNKPGDDPFVVTVGAADVGDLPGPEDDQVAEFSSRTSESARHVKPDLVAPGVRMVSNVAPGSTIAEQYPEAMVDAGHIRGTGTSQATAVVAGVAALVFHANPALTPDEAKSVLVETADPLMDQSGAGAGLIDAAEAVDAAAGGGPYQPANQGVAWSGGLGRLDPSRGSVQVVSDTDGDGVPEPVSGERDVLGNAWESLREQLVWMVGQVHPLWRPILSEHQGWDGNSWGGNSWSGTSWSGNSWSGNVWSTGAWR